MSGTPEAVWPETAVSPIVRRGAALSSGYRTFKMMCFTSKVYNGCIRTPG